jgi:hypothetical protein
MPTGARELEKAELADPILAHVPLLFAAMVNPSGFPFLIRSNSPAVAEMAEANWAGAAKRSRTRPGELRYVVAGAGTPLTLAPVIRAQRNLLVWVADRENFAVCDMARNFGVANITKAVLAQRDYFRYHFLESMVACLLDTRHLVAIHAACVELNGHGVLLAGESGAGKSSLSYACARNGWTYISDDASSLLRRGSGRTVVGNPRLFRFRQAAGSLFPEFRGLKESRRANGKPTIEVRTESLPALRTASEARVDYIVFLNRRTVDGCGAKLIPVTAQEALARLYVAPWPSELSSTAEQRAALRRLLGAGLYELKYRDLDAAVDSLRRLVEGGSK